MKESLRSKVILFLFFCLFIGQVYSMVVQSISLILLAIVSFFEFGTDNNKIYVNFSKEYFKKYINVFRQPIYWLFMLFFIYLLIPYSECLDPEYLHQRLIIKLPFLFLPAAFLTYDRRLKEYLPKLFTAFLGVLFIQFIIIIAYQLNASIETVDLLRVGKSINTPGSHIKFSVITAMVIVTNFYFLLFTKSKSTLISRIQLLLIIACALFLHYLSVRTGLVVLYIGILSLSIIYSIKKEKKVIGLAIALSVLLTPIIFYQSSEGFKNKVNYMLYDLNQYNIGEGHNYSDSGRLASLDVGIELFKENPWIGVGSCNIRPKSKQKFNKLYPKYEQMLLPHNQFLFTATNGGILGLICITIGFFIPFFLNGFKSPYVIAMFFCLLTLFVFDQILEGTVGVGIFLFYSMITFTFLSDDHTQPST